MGWARMRAAPAQRPPRARNAIIKLVKRRFFRVKNVEAQGRGLRTLGFMMGGWVRGGSDRDDTSKARRSPDTEREQKGPFMAELPILAGELQNKHAASGKSRTSRGP
jgi:hypothetical protein